MNTVFKNRALWPILGIYCFANAISPAFAESIAGSSAQSVSKANAPVAAYAKKKKKKKKTPTAPKPTPQSDRPLCLTSSGQILVPAGASCPSNSTAATLQSFLTQGTSGDIGPQGPKGDTGETGSTGSTGATGPQGADGALRIFGDGSRLELDPPSSITLTDFNTQYTNVNIRSGVTLTVPSGTVIRCTGTFTNAGTIEVTPVAAGGYRSAFTSTTYFPALRSADAGNSNGSAGSGEYGTSSAALVGGLASPALDPIVAARLLSPGIKGGGGGAPGRRDAGMGGGALTVLCAGGITNTGSIIANGTDAPTPTGGGGGAGGIIILGSNTSITSVGSSLITANGGRGGDAAVGTDLVATTNGAGGGGAGGIITLISPFVTTNVTSNLEVLGGTPGSISGITGSGSRRVGGGAGGSFGGKGGDGGGVARTTGAPTAAEAGGVGIKTVIDSSSHGIADITPFRF